MVEINSYKFNVISNSNPLVVPIPSIFGTSNMGGSRRRKRIEIEDFKWLGSFPKDYKSLSLDGFDYENVPPNFFFFRLGSIITDGVVNEDGNNINVIEFAHPMVGFEHFATLQGTQNSSTTNTTNTTPSTTNTTSSDPITVLNRPDPSKITTFHGGNIIQQWEPVTPDTSSLINVNIPSINSATLSYSHYKILYGIDNDHSDGIDLGNLVSGKLQIDIMANINILLARKNAVDPELSTKTSTVYLESDLFNNENVLYPFERRNVGTLGKLTEDYVLRFRIYDVEDL